MHARVAQVLVDGCEKLLVRGLDHLRGEWGGGGVRGLGWVDKGRRGGELGGVEGVIATAYPRGVLEQGHALLAVICEVLSARSQRILSRCHLFFKNARILETG